LPTRLLMGLASLYKSPWELVIFGVVLFGAVLLVIKGKGRERLHNLVLQTPVAGTYVRALALERWARVMASLLKAGFTLPDALQLSAEAVGLPALKKELKRLGQKIVEGGGLAMGLSSSSFFSPMVAELVAAG